MEQKNQNKTRKTFKERKGMFIALVLVLLHSYFPGSAKRDYSFCHLNLGSSHKGISRFGGTYCYDTCHWTFNCKCSLHPLLLARKCSGLFYIHTGNQKRVYKAGYKFSSSDTISTSRNRYRVYIRELTPTILKQ